MAQNLTDFLKVNAQQNYAQSVGTTTHALLQNIVIDGDVIRGDENTIKIIKPKPDLQRFFSINAKTEVPIAGIIRDQFISRRIDRMLINPDNKTIDFIDYKTDTDKTKFIKKYRAQLTEYAELLHSAYPDYKINGFILWLHDWNLDKII